MATTPALAAPEKKAQSSSSTKKPVKSSSAASSKNRPAAKSSVPRKAAVAAAAPVAVEPESSEPPEPLSDVQLVLATMVQVGQADCEFQQTVHVEPNERQSGSFLVKYRKATYTMVPEPTTTGAIRLVDPKAGIAWLQIRYKSMLMNTRAGQRMVDACSMPEQRLAEAEAERMVRAAAEQASSYGEVGPDMPVKELPLLRN